MPPPPISPQQQALNDAKEHLAAGRYDEAIKLATTLIPEKKPTALTPTALLVRGQAQVQKGNLSKALEDFSKSIERNPYDETVFNSRGNVYLKKKMYDHAIQDYTNAICIKSSSATAWNSRATVYAAQGMWNAAEYECTKAIACDPLYKPAFTTRGYIRNVLGQHAEAVEDLHQAIAWDPENVEALYHLAYAQYCLGVPDAPEYAHRALDIDPNHAPASQLVVDIPTNAKHDYAALPIQL
jgi:tetratricopeptide (TPR) repeat protein|eukprot:CAMPEP_0174293832 /NCGR_PEP_ID=MMETSP0809-20121228/39821_1 /TAXON_ID=73025 ORGANISM="Eutreptiella gymnastica-like, Strain CCMP1594" /NCGR_SAMPLE_ID=MMETSP0809 /ASSEMBLY_ACC=CAM_ASM_000658 /LENGTH=239 /DNA_ID=CAMNT_0015394891 /DNA_START=63 /DNA_END=782 /DNA_ORIENTATION=+